MIKHVFSFGWVKEQISKRVSLLGSRYLWLSMCFSFGGKRVKG
jgi:hypothetical protein